MFSGSAAIFFARLAHLVIVPGIHRVAHLAVPDGGGRRGWGAAVFTTCLCVQETAPAAASASAAG